MATMQYFCIALIFWIMAKKKAKNKSTAQPVVIPQTAVVQEGENELFDLSDPDEFRKAFIAAEILNRKY